MPRGLWRISKSQERDVGRDQYHWLWGWLVPVSVVGGMSKRYSTHQTGTGETKRASETGGGHLPSSSPLLVAIVIPQCSTS